MSSSENVHGRSAPSRRELAELSALADGTLSPGRRTEVEARIADSPELSALYEQERRVAELLREARASTRAPDALRARIQAAAPSRPVRVRRSARYGGGLAGALAVIVLALVLALPGGTPGAPSVSQAAAVAARGATAPAPAPDPNNPAGNLSRDVQEIYFPNWSSSFGWTATGQRVDTIDGRRAITVYYDWKGKRIAYTIVAAPALAQPRAHVSDVKGTVLRTFKLNGRLVVTWRRGGHTCVLSGAHIDAGTLQALASWQAPRV